MGFIWNIHKVHVCACKLRDKQTQHIHTYIRRCEWICTSSRALISHPKHLCDCLKRSCACARAQPRDLRPNLVQRIYSEEHSFFSRTTKRSQHRSSLPDVLSVNPVIIVPSHWTCAPECVVIINNLKKNNKNKNSTIINNLQSKNHTRSVRHRAHIYIRLFAPIG